MVPSASGRLSYCSTGEVVSRTLQLCFAEGQTDHPGFRDALHRPQETRRQNQRRSYLLRAHEGHVRVNTPRDRHPASRLT